MGYIFYALNNSANCAGMAPPALPGGAFGLAALPAGMAMAGTYIIVNTATNNRYIGIAANIHNRFQTRLATVTEMGFSPAVLANIGVTWGIAHCRNTLPALPAPPVPPPPPLLQPVAGSFPVAPVAGAPYTAVIDGAVINLEHLLIRFVMSQLGGGGTVSNNLMVAPYANPTANPITVSLQWGAMGGLFAANTMQAVWGPGVAW